MNLLRQAFLTASHHARAKRAMLFKSLFRIDSQTRILDLGSEDASHIGSILKGTSCQSANIFIADINQKSVERGHETYGFSPITITEDEALPFPDNFFDIVYCSSVIEHVTIPKDEVWSMISGQVFRTRSKKRQRAFAKEIQRLGKSYFVQTPYRHFPIESHSWLPSVGWMPRRMLIPTLKFTNRFWIKKTRPDWYLLTKQELGEMFESARILEEKVFGLTKSIIAVSQSEITSAQ